MSNETKAKKTTKILAGIIFLALIAILIVKWVYPNAIPYGMFELWALKAPIWTVITSSAPLFIWAIAVAIIIVPFFRKTSGIKNNIPAENPKQNLANDIFYSIYGSMLEGVLFRWLIFLNFIWIIKLFDWLGSGVFEWLYISLIAPLVSLSSFGLIDNIIYHPYGWAIGAAIIITNAIKTKNHVRLGIFGLTNSWYIGLYLFALTLQFGLWASIAIHFLYDATIDLTQYCINIYNKPHKK